MRPRGVPSADRLAFGLKEFAQLAGLDYRLVREAVMSGRLPATRHGRRYVIPRGAALAFLGEPDPARTDPGQGEA
jgi:excisionase family DNA binding protein